MKPPAAPEIPTEDGGRLERIGRSEGVALPGHEGAPDTPSSPWSDAYESELAALDLLRRMLGNAVAALSGANSASYCDYLDLAAARRALDAAVGELSSIASRRRLREGGRG